MNLEEAENIETIRMNTWTASIEALIKILKRNSLRKVGEISQIPFSTFSTTIQYYHTIQYYETDKKGYIWRV
jgi:hypothetical protein